MKLLKIVFVLLSIVLFFSCGDQAVSPKAGASINFEFVESGDSGAECLVALPHITGQLELHKPLNLDAIDEARVMVVDISMFESHTAFNVSEERAAFEEAKRNWDGDLRTWGEWEKLFGDYFRLVVNQSLQIDGHHAQGTVSGVIGLNLVIVMIFENGTRIGFYEDSVTAIEGETVKASLPYHSDNWYY